MSVSVFCFCHNLRREEAGCFFSFQNVTIKKKSDNIWCLVFSRRLIQLKEHSEGNAQDSNQAHFV